MRWSALSLFGFLSLFAATPSVHAAGENYGVLIISRERLEVSTSCEIGVYIQDELAARLFQEQSTAFNLPPGNVSLRLKLLPGNVPGCNPGMLVPRRAEHRAQGRRCVEVPDCDVAGRDVPQARHTRLLSEPCGSEPARTAVSVA